MRIRFSSVASLLLLLPWGLALQAQTTADFFNDTVLQDVRLTMAPADWQSLHDKYMENGYYPCDFQWNGITLPRTGIRSRGTQSRSPIKPSIGLDFGKYVSSQRFLGLKTLILRNLNQDASMMRERLAEATFAKLGLPHSREAHARLFVNGEYVGVYLLVEAIDARFLQTQLGDDTGYLYDYTLRSNFRFDYLGPDPATYVPAIFDPKTHSDDPDTAGLIEMFRLVNQSPDAEFYRLVSPVVDLDDFVAHAAAEQALAQWDGLLGVSGMNNFYLYRWGPTRQALFLVWDQDGAFDSIERSVWEGTDANILLRRALTVPRLRKLYTDTLRSTAGVFGGQDGWLEREVNRIDAQIHDAVVADPVRLCRMPDGIGPCPLDEYTRSIAFLRGFAHDRATLILKELGPETAPGPVSLAPGCITNVASGGMPVTAGSLARINATLPVTTTSHATAYPLPTVLDSVSVSTSAGLAPLLEVGPKGIVFLVPPALSCAPQPVHVTVGESDSNTIMADVMPTAGGIFGFTHAQGLLVTTAAPAAPGEIVVAYATGVWPGSTASPPKTVQMFVGGVPANVLWMGTAPGLVGVEQFNFVVPATTVSGDVPVVLTLDSEPGTAFPLCVGPGGGSL